ncbi:GntR family transcriptional regulator [Bacillus sp. BRMEA1]|uniref:GntR family transcriptional regulator n=1 Tax=Neobacillus endophyticus TaxID=2738405 RepID=UPI0015669D22|nr:GntR family transcriptional regulator [Neobacillus endophyticus]NRD79157.1 GntR family transcriptional regulator [Neobacillus endophyticus]
MLKNRTMEQQAYDMIKEGIIEGRYRPGTHLTEAKLVKDLQMSRTPIRKALGQLETEGLLTHHSHHGSIVKNIQKSTMEIINMVEIQLNFARASIEKAEKKQLIFDILTLRECLEVLDRAYLEENGRDFYQTIEQFFASIIRLNRNNLMEEIMERLWKRFLLGTAEPAFQLRKQGIQNLIKQYKELVDDLEQKNYNQAIELLKEINVGIVQDLIL